MKIKINNKYKPYQTVSRWLSIYLVAVIAVVVLAATSHSADSVNFEFRNSMNEKVLVYLYWLDHDWDYPGPVNLAGGEMKSGQVWELKHDYKPGKYVIVWKSMDSKELKVVYPERQTGLIIDELK